MSLYSNSTVDRGMGANDVGRDKMTSETLASLYQIDDGEWNVQNGGDVDRSLSSPENAISVFFAG